MAERFQPRIIASFNKHSLELATNWWKEHGYTDPSNKTFEDIVSKSLDASELDEKGKPLDTRGKVRLTAAIAVLTQISQKRMEIRGLRGDIKVWQLTEDAGILRIEWARSIPRR